MRLAEIEKRLAEIRNTINTRGAELTAEEIAALDKEVTELTEERATIMAAAAAAEQRAALLTNIAAGTEGGTVVRSFAPAQAETEEERFKRSYRSAFFKRLMGKALNEVEQRDFQAQQVAPVQ